MLPIEPQSFRWVAGIDRPVVLVFRSLCLVVLLSAPTGSAETGPESIELHAVPAGPDVHLWWSAPAGDVDTYHVHRSGPDGMTLVGQANGTTFVDTPPDTGVYRYHVAAYFEGELVATSNEATAASVGNCPVLWFEPLDILAGDPVLWSIQVALAAPWAVVDLAMCLGPALVEAEHIVDDAELPVRVRS